MSDTVPTLKYVQHLACGAIYLRGVAERLEACGYCEEPFPQWEPWDPRQGNLTEKELISAIQSILDELSDSELHSEEGRLYFMYADLITAVIAHAPQWTWLYTEETPDVSVPDVRQ